MNPLHRKKAEVKIKGMTCNSCEIMLERALKTVEGILAVDVNHKTGIAHITADAAHLPPLETIRSVIQDAGYRLAENPQRAAESLSSGQHSKQKWLEIGACLLMIFALYKILQALDIISYASELATASTLGGIFVIGLVAGTSSCLAVTGGMLLSMAAKYNEANASMTRRQKFKPLLAFNIGRLLSYFAFGGLVGMIGKAITLTPRMTGYMNIGVALIMLALALSILKIIPKSSFGLHLPKRFSHWIADLSESKNPAAPCGLGAMTFFLPCGFTQSLQFVALASGSAITGAFTMFVFALGTLPSLLGISTLSATAKGTTARLFLRFSGTLVLVLALFNLQSGLSLTGFDVSNALVNAFTTSSTITDAAADPNVTFASDGTQIINLRVSAYGYTPIFFTVEREKPTIIQAVADSNIAGCTSVLIVPAFGLAHNLKPGNTTSVGPFIPTDDFLITCSMGMVRAHVKVVSKNR